MRQDRKVDTRLPRVVNEERRSGCRGWRAARMTEGNLATRAGLRWDLRTGHG